MRSWKQDILSMECPLAHWNCRPLPFFTKCKTVPTIFLFVALPKCCSLHSNSSNPKNEYINNLSDRWTVIDVYKINTEHSRQINTNQWWQVKLKPKLTNAECQLIQYARLLHITGLNTDIYQCLSQRLTINPSRLAAMLSYEKLR